MEIITTVKSISHQVLNELTGELEYKTFNENPIKKKIVKGGWRMTYPAYDEALISIVKSGKDLEVVTYIRELFTKNRVENVLSKTDLAKALDVSDQKITDIINRMLSVKLLMRVSRGVYRLNPFMYLPCQSEGPVLQKEWKELSNVP